jgi:hypothetical protein
MGRNLTGASLSQAPRSHRALSPVPPGRNRGNRFLPFRKRASGGTERSGSCVDWEPTHFPKIEDGGRRPGKVIALFAEFLY